MKAHRTPTFAEPLIRVLEALIHCIDLEL